MRNIYGRHSFGIVLSLSQGIMESFVYPWEYSEDPSMSMTSRLSLTIPFSIEEYSVYLLSLSSTMLVAWA